MAVAFAASAGGYHTTAGLPAAPPFSMTWWVYWVTVPTAPGIYISLDSSTSQILYFAYEPALSAQTIDWPGTGYITGPNVIAGTWYKMGFTVAGTTAKFYSGIASATLVTYNQAGGSFVIPTGTLKLWIGDSSFGNYYSNFRIAAFKMWHTELTKLECEQELQSYVPQRLVDLTRWYPMIGLDPTDYSGNGRTLNGGASASLAPGPPIAWSRPKVPVVPWDPSSTVWYAVYDTTTGELISTGSSLPVSGVLAGQAYKEYLNGQPNLSVYEWSTTARDLVLRESVARVDRVADLLADTTLTAAWASLTGPESTAMQARIGQLLGPYRYRQSFQDIDLS